MAESFKHLFQPYHIGKLELKNRIVMSGMVTNYASEDGYATDRTMDYYEARARGGVSMVTVEASCIDAPVAKAFWQLVIDDDKYIPKLSELTQRIRNAGAKAAIQLAHPGAAARSSFTKIQPVGPSPITKNGVDIPRELTTAEVENNVMLFAYAAKRAQKAGFDGVEIHGAHGYLISEFLSSYFNKRTDKYGGPLTNRARFLLEIIKECKKITGGDFPVWFRINGQEYGPQAGLTSADAQQVALMAQEAGADAVDVSLSTAETIMRAGPHQSQGRGVLVDLAAAIKKVVNIPVMVVNRIDCPTGEKVISEGKADFVLMGRGLIADPETPNKAAAGKLDDIKPCIACLYCLENVVMLTKPLCCVVNPATGREKELVISASPKQKKIFVVGGGPSGMEAARVAALRGHKVTLFEKNRELGGQLRLACVPPHKDSINLLIDFEQQQLKKLAVDVKLDNVAQANSLSKDKPDAVIVAAGPSPITPKIPGIDKPNVVSFIDVLKRNVTVGKNVVVIGGNQVGSETAEFLAASGKAVTIVEILKELAVSMYPLNKQYLFGRMSESGIKSYTGVKKEEILDDGIRITTKDDEDIHIKADTIVIAVGSRPVPSVVEEWKLSFPDALAVGDCIETRDIMTSMLEGYKAGLKV